MLPGLPPPYAFLREFVYGGYNYLIGSSPTVRIGGKIIINDMISLELAASRYFFIPARAQFELVKMNKSITNFGTGMTLKVL